jgi:hypothetical protein
MGAFPLLDPRNRLRSVDHHLLIWKGFKPCPILDETRYAGLGGGTVSPAVGAR